MQIDIRGFYEQYFTITKENLIGDELTVVCPFHEDTKPSLSINLQTGLWKCHAHSCDTNDATKGGGNTAKFYILMEAIDDKLVSYNDATQYLRDNFGKEEEAPAKKKVVKPLANFPVTDADVEEHHKTLMSNPNALKTLMDMGWDEDVITKFQIGLNRTERRVWIPIREGGKLVNIRKYSRQNKNKMLNISKFGQARIWPQENLEYGEVFLFEGEKDCILANKLGLNAVTVTGGAGTFQLEWASLFLNKVVNICYDVDEAGQKGAEKVRQLLEMSAEKINVIKLPITEPSNADFTDYILQGNTVDDFLELVAREAEEEVEEVIDDPIINTTLDETANKKLFFKKIQMKIRVVCKHNPDYVIPKKVKVACNRGNGKTCYVCPINKENRAEKTLTERTPQLLEYIDSTNRQHRQIIESMFDIPKCHMFKHSIEEHQPVEFFEAVPSLDEAYSKDRDEKYTKAEFFMLNMSADANTDYEIKAVPVPDPRSQKLVYIGYAVEPCQSSIDGFELTQENKQQLRIFQCQKSETS